MEEPPQRDSKKMEYDEGLPAKKWQKAEQSAKKGTVKLPELNKV